MARVALAVLALLLAGHGCAAVDDTTTVAGEQHLSTTDDPSPAPVSAAPRASCFGPLLSAIFALMLVGQACAAPEATTTIAEGPHLSTTDGPSPAPVSTALRASGTGPMLLALLALLVAGRGCTALDLDETTTVADGPQLSTTDGPSPAPVSAAPRASAPGLMLALAAALGLAARR
jgi:hypothetical protein